MAGTNNRAAGTFENEAATETTAEVRGDKIAVVVLGDVESNPISLEREAAGAVLEWAATNHREPATRARRSREC
jgi:hypothetical protein